MSPRCERLCSAVRVLYLAVCMLLFFLLVGPSATIAQQYPPQYYAETGHWYQLVVAQANVFWPDARDSAFAMGGYLVSILSVAENDFVKSIISNPPIRSAYIGGFEFNGEDNNWQWVSGEPWGYTNWNAGEPNDGCPSNCGQESVVLIHGMELGPAIFGTWNDGIPGTIPAGSYGFVIEYDSRVACFDPFETIPVGTRPIDIVAVDLDGDGDEDLAVVDDGADDVKVLMNDGNGSFSATIAYPVGDGPQSIFAFKADADSDFDLVTANLHDDDASVLLNNGDGSFAAKVDYATGHQPNYVIGSDLDADGDADLVAVNYLADDFGEPPVSVLKGNGDGTFQPAVKYHTQSGTDGPASVIAADLDGDLDKDLAVPIDGSVVSVLKNNGDGSFVAGINYPAGSNPRGAVAADVDFDDDLDLAVTNILSDNVSVLVNNGDATFQAPVNYAVGDRPVVAINATDLLGNGTTDIVVANSLDDNVSVLLNLGNGTFATADNFPVGDGPFAVVAVDIDGNGTVDLATANESGSISILRSCGACNCDCHGNPVCDGAICDVLDVVSAVSVAFRNGAAIPDPDTSCLFETTDVDCSTLTDVIDVVKIVSVAFRNADPATEFCEPCP